MRHALSILVLTEDGSTHAHRTLSRLVSRMLRLVEPSAQTQRVEFQPAEQSTRLGVRANLWKSWKSPRPRDQRAIRNLRRTLATKILEEGVPGYVFFHFDGDCPWTKRKRSENARKFESFVLGLRKEVAANLETRGLPSKETDVDARLRRICPITPYYSIEAWLYQNLDLVRDACRRRCGRHFALIDEWENDRALLEEVIKPKEQLCVGSTMNEELAKALTSQLAKTLDELGQSFHATVECLEACPGLSEALAETWRIPS